MVKVLSAEGMSTRAAAPIVGGSHKTVVKDSQARREVVPEVPPADAPQFDPDPIVTGRDGKTYVRPEPKPEATEEKDEVTMALAERPKLSGPNGAASPGPRRRPKLSHRGIRLEL
ncbi:hypothetical protein [Arthrobacter sp. JSM 101049]|uniref:hypothetical protein n=1 Tax=Arthrobacter sp. JSM 101049 TaxID=929097 RepID=UPI003566DFD7